jgi:hypothetical protein
MNKPKTDASYILAYTLKRLGVLKIDKEDYRLIDYFEIFCERNEFDDTPLRQCKNRLAYLQELEDKHDELYSWSICKIVSTSEHYNVNK